MQHAQETLHFLDYWRVVRSRKEIVISVGILVVLTGFLITLAMPKVYKASVLIKVKDESPDVPIFETQPLRYDPLFLRTQFELIQSGPVLEEVVKRRGLDDKLGRAYAFESLPPDKKVARAVKILRRSMKVQQYRDTNLIQIEVYLSEPKESAPQEAAETAQAIAEVFRLQSLERSREIKERALRALEQSLLEYSNRVMMAEQNVEAIRAKYKIDLVSTEAGTQSELTKMTIVQLEAQRTKAHMDLADREARYKLVQSLTPDNLRDAAPYLVGDASLAGLIATKRTREIELAEALKSLGPKHPTVVSIQTVIDEVESKIADAMAGLKTGVKADYEAAKATVEILDKRLEELRSSNRRAESEEYREFDRAAEELQHAKSIYRTMESRYLQEKIEMRIPRSNVEIVEPARAPDEDDPDSPNFPLNIVVSVVLGLGAGVGLAFFVEYLDTSVKTLDEVEKRLGASVIGVIPQKVKPFSDPSSDPAHGEAYRVLRTNIQFSRKVQGGKTFCLTSGSVGEGKSLTACNLAWTSAQLGDRVLLVDADIHRPRQHKILRLANTKGLADVLMGEVSLEEAITATSLTNLDVLLSGRVASGTRGLLDTRRLKELVEIVRQSYDLVLFDTPPVIGVSDASLVVREVDGVILVIQHRKYPFSVSQRAKAIIDNLGANLVGVVLNNINVSRDYSYYYYHHHYYSYPHKKGGGTSKS